MCGLFGVAGDLSHKDLEVFKHLALASQTRGTDATGLAAFKAHNGGVEIHKLAVPSSIFLDTKQADRLISAQYDCLLGHTRKSTSHYTSKHDVRDAHPFQHGDIVGAHNGVIPFSALEKLPHKLDNAIDSEKLIYNISKEGVDGVIPEIWGAYALSLLDTKSKKLGFVRNSQRTLSIAYSKSMKTVYWASEYYMLLWAISRENIDIAKDGAYCLNEDVFIEFTWEGRKPFAETAQTFELKGGKEPEKKTTGTVVGGTHARGNTTNSTTEASRSNVREFNPGRSTNRAPLSELERTVRSIRGMEEALLNFNYHTKSTWPKRVRERFDSLLQSLNNAYLDLESGKLSNEAPEPDSPTLEQELRTRIREALKDNGCAFCCSSEVDDKQLDQCTIGKDSKTVLCPMCAGDEALRQMADAPEPLTPFKPLALPRPADTPVVTH